MTEEKKATEEERLKKYYEMVYKKGIEEHKEKIENNPFCPLIKDNCELNDCEFFIFDEEGAECSIKRIGKQLNLLIEISGNLRRIYDSQ